MSFRIHEATRLVFKTTGPRHHFFGYYDKSPVDAASTRLLSHQVEFDWKRMPKAGDVVGIGYWDLGGSGYTPLAETRAYNWQQGAQLQWLGPGFSDEIIFNDCVDGEFVSRVVGMDGSVRRTLPRAVYTVDPDGSQAICVNYRRLFHTHKGYDYLGGSDAEGPRWRGELPEGDGLTLMDLKTGRHNLVLSTREVAAHRPLPIMRGAQHMLDHAMFSPDGRHVSFLHRWLYSAGIYSRLFVLDVKSGKFRCLSDSGMVSHSGWRGGGHLVAWARPESKIANLRKSRFAKQLLTPILPLWRRLTSTGTGLRAAIVGDSYIEFEVESNPVRSRVYGPRANFPGDGHNTFHPTNPRWMLTDSYEDSEFHRQLLLHDAERDVTIELGRFLSVPETCSTGFRCDLHPRWSLDGKMVCFDSSHEGGQRQTYLLHVHDLLG